MDLLALLDLEASVAATHRDRMRADQAMFIRMRDGEITAAELALWRDEQGVACGYYDLHPERRADAAYLARCRAETERKEARRGLD